MKKTILFVIFCLSSGSTACTEELVVHLTSGNAVVIEYTGTIHGVSFQGKNDGIAAVNMPAMVKPAIDPTQQPISEQQRVNPPAETMAGQKEQGGRIRYKWADPIGED